MKITALRTTGSTLTVVACLFAGGSVASAQNNISGTGAGSNNGVTVSEKCDSKTENNNVIDIVTGNDQTSESGSVIVRDNDDVKNAGSGSAGNSSDTRVEVGVENKTGSDCSPAGGSSGGSPETPTTPTTNQAVSGGRGGGSAAVAEVAQVATPAGGVGAGSGGQTYLTGLVAITIASGAWATIRLRKQFGAEA